MIRDVDFYTLTQEVSGAIFGAVAAVRAKRGELQPELPPLLQLRRGQAESPAWFLVQAAEFDPESISVAKLRVRDVYASERIVFALLELLASEKWLEPLADGEYVLTGSGRETLGRLLGRTHRAIEELETMLVPSSMNPEELKRLDVLLRRVIEASLEVDDPPGNWCLSYSRRRAPAADASSLVKINQYASDFNAFRDDAHMAAWRPLALGGHVWEAFSFIWAGLAQTAGEIDRQLFYRGYSRAEYALALEELASRGWLSEDENEPGRYVMTDEGQALRDKAEKLTNEFFYDPWRCLDKEEVSEVHKLLTQLQETLGAQ